jgi:hypothetical protein
MRQAATRERRVRRCAMRVGMMCLPLAGMSGASQETRDARVLRRASQPLVNQAGYNLGEAKRFE